MSTNAPTDAVATAVAKIPSGLAVLTATHKERSTGLLASWVQQASFEPLMLTVCVKAGRPIESMIDGSGRFVVNVLGENATSLLKHFGRGFGPDDDAFAGLPVRVRDYGVQLEACIAHVACNVTEKVPAGDHFVYIGRVVAGEAKADAKPYVHLRKSATSY